MEQAIQFAGAVGILVAFAALQTGRLSATSATYLWLNVSGAGLLTVSALIENQWGFVLLESIWTAVAFWGLLRRDRTASCP